MDSALQEMQWWIGVISYTIGIIIGIITIIHTRKVLVYLYRKQIELTRVCNSYSVDIDPFESKRVKKEYVDASMNKQEERNNNLDEYQDLESSSPAAPLIPAHVEENIHNSLDDGRKQAKAPKDQDIKTIEDTEFAKICGYEIGRFRPKSIKGGEGECGTSSNPAICTMNQECLMTYNRLKRDIPPTVIMIIAEYYKGIVVNCYFCHKSVVYYKDKEIGANAVRFKLGSEYVYYCKECHDKDRKCEQCQISYKLSPSSKCCGSCGKILYKQDQCKKCADTHSKECINCGDCICKSCWVEYGICGNDLCAKQESETESKCWICFNIPYYDIIGEIKEDLEECVECSALCCSRCRWYGICDQCVKIEPEPTGYDYGEDDEFYLH